MGNRPSKYRHTNIQFHIYYWVSRRIVIHQKNIMRPTPAPPQRTPDRRLPFRFAPARSYCHLTAILSILLSPNYAISAYPTCQRLLSECTIIYTTSAAGIPVYLSDIQTPKPLVLLRTAFHWVARVPLRGTGSSTRFDAAAQSSAVSAFALPAASTLNSLGIIDYIGNETWV
jgi:hypothetical protein